MNVLAKRKEIKILYESNKCVYLMVLKETEEGVEKVGNFIQRWVVGPFGDKIIRMEEDIRFLREGINEIKQKLDAKYDERLSNVEKKLIELASNGKYTKSRSPISLNTAGLKLLNKTGMKKFIDEYNKDYIKEVLDLKPRNDYQIQEFSRRVLFNDFKGNRTYCKKNYEKLQKEAYLLGIDVDEILYVGSIYLRNLILKKLDLRRKDS